MSTIHEIEDRIYEAKKRRSLLTKNAAAMSSKNHIKSARMSAEARKETALIGQLEQALRGMS